MWRAHWRIERVYVSGQRPVVFGDIGIVELLLVFSSTPGFPRAAAQCPEACAHSPPPPGALPTLGRRTSTRFGPTTFCCSKSPYHAERKTKTRKTRSSQNVWLGARNTVFGENNCFPVVVSFDTLSAGLCLLRGRSLGDQSRPRPWPQHVGVLETKHPARAGGSRSKSSGQTCVGS